MTLRTRILLGYGYLIGLLLLSVSVAAINSQRVAGNSKQILERNIRNLTQAITMLEQLERQDSETLLALLQPTTGTRLDDAERAFETALATADDISKANLDDEDRPILGSVRNNFEDYRKARAELLSRVYEDPLTAAEDYREGTQKALLRLKDELTSYVTRKTESLKQANDAASRSAVEGAVLLGVMVTVALLSLGFLSRSLQRDVLGRLTEVGHVTEAIAAGDRRRRVRDFYQDELGLVARQLNAALDRQHELESQMQGRLLEQRRALVGLMNQWPTPAGMIGIDGEIVASTLNADDENELHRLTPRVRAAAKVLMTRRFVRAEELAVDIKAGDGRRTVQIRALASGDNQIAGWLASFIDPGAPEASGVYPIAREPSGLHPGTREPTGLLHPLPGGSAVMPVDYDALAVEPVPHEPSGFTPVTFEASHDLPGTPELSGVRPVSRAGSGALSMARSGPLPRAHREGSGARNAALAEATHAVNEAMLTDPDMRIAEVALLPDTITDASSLHVIALAIPQEDIPLPSEPGGASEHAGSSDVPRAMQGSDALGLPPAPGTLEPASKGPDLASALAGSSGLVAPDPERPTRAASAPVVPSLPVTPAGPASGAPSFAPPPLPRPPAVTPSAPQVAAGTPARDPDDRT